MVSVVLVLPLILSGVRWEPSVIVGASAVSPERQEENTGMGQVSDGNSLTDVLVLMVQGVPELKKFSYS